MTYNLLFRLASEGRSSAIRRAGNERLSSEKGYLKGRILSYFLTLWGSKMATCPLINSQNCFKKGVKTRQNWLKGIKAIYMQKHRKSEDFRCFVSEIIGNTAAISAWRTEEHDVQPSDRTEYGLKTDFALVFKHFSHSWM